MGRIGWHRSWLALLPCLVAGAPASAEIPVKVIISRVVQIGPLDASSIGDPYARVTINGFAAHNGLRRCQDGDLTNGSLPFTFFENFAASPLCPGPHPWTFAMKVDPGPATVVIEIIDDDGDSTERARLLPDGSRSIELVIDPATGRWSGDVEWPESCNPELDGDDAVRVCFHASFDADGDGLLDVWERDGIDVDNDPMTGPMGVDLDLPALGANPLHKDLFVEIDWMSLPDASEDGSDPASCTNGVDDDGDGFTDLDDRACTLGAPTPQAVALWQEAFALAPIDAGCSYSKPAELPDDPLDIGVCRVPNPDEEPGIRLWVDAGRLRDSTAKEDGRMQLTCEDGIDNGGDGLIDLDDPDCQVGDDLGGGNRVPFQNVSAMNRRYYDLKRANFDRARELAFRYMLVAPMPVDIAGVSSGGNTATTLVDAARSWLDDEWRNVEVAIVGGTGAEQQRTIATNGATTLTVSTPWETIPDATSEYEIQMDGPSLGEKGGNDALIRPFLGPVADRCRAAVLMHELGHTLDLAHGGTDDNNCKPNYVSIMNYDHTCGIEGSDLLDYSPPRLPDFPGFRGTAPLPDLDESNLAPLVLDIRDQGNEFVWTDGEGGKVSSHLRSLVDWGGLTQLNIDGADAGGSPSECAKKNGALTVLEGSHDWRRVSLSLLEFGENASRAIDVVDAEGELAPDEIVELTERMNSTDLAIAKSAGADTVEAGVELSYRIEVSNEGPRPARQVEVRDFLPTEVTLLEADPACDREDDGSLRCDLGELQPDEDRGFDLRVSVDRACAGGTPVPEIENRAEVRHVFDLAGPDLDPEDDSSSARVSVVDTTPPEISCNTPPTLAPNEAPVRLEPTVEDACDASAALRLTGFDCFRLKKQGVMSKLASCVVELEEEAITVVDSGGVHTTISFDVSARDQAGNVSETRCSLDVVAP